MIRIHNIRLRFACNSSSTHSVVLLPGGAPDDDVAHREFGWANWTAGSRDAKLDYLGIAVSNELSRLMPEELAHAVTHDLLGSPGCDFGVERGYIDHQSLWTIPMSWDGSFVDTNYVADLRDFLLRDDVVILGGNDNNCQSHPVGEDPDAVTALKDVPTELYNHELVARRDPLNGSWALFNRSNGNKVRISFDPRTPNPVRAALPELVDVKITSYCPFFNSTPTCRSCYQASDTSGTHASLASITAIADALGAAKVFEVAIGGGEPTLHPQFAGILHAFRSRGVVPNFTTRTLKWIDNPTIVEAVKKYSGGFALSVESPEDVVTLSSKTISFGGQGMYESKKVSVAAQVVLGAVSIETLGEIFVAAAENHVAITVLGWKTTGRGGSGPLHDVSGWVKIAKDSKLWMIGMDTEALRQWGHELSGDLRVLTTPEEGRFSAYWDAVTGRFGPSSFCDDSAMIKVGSDPASFDIATTMASFP